MYFTRAVHKETELILNLFPYLQLNQNCLLKSTPLPSRYTASNVFSSFGTRPGTCFAGWREGPLSNFLLPPPPSEIGDILVRILTSGTRKSPQGPNLESMAAGGQQSSHASSKIHGYGVTREQEHCHGAASRCCLSTPQACVLCGLCVGSPINIVYRPKHVAKLEYRKLWLCSTEKYVFFLYRQQLL